MRLAAVFLFSLISCLCSPWVDAQASGDVNGNGFIDQPDVEMLRDHLLQAIDLSDAQALRADCNGQDGIDAGDLVWIVNRGGTFVGSEMITVTAGSFDMGDPWDEGTADEFPVHPVTLSTYEIGRHEVTNAEYVHYLNSALAAGEIYFEISDANVYLVGNSDDRLTSTYHVNNTFALIEHSGGTFVVRPRDEHSMLDHPVSVSWYGAAAYCNWLSRRDGYQEVYTESDDWLSVLGRSGYHLSTEAQWERAAAWEPGHGHWRYGFMSDTLDYSRANYSQSGSSHANPLSITLEPLTSPVGFYSGTTTARTGPTVDGPSPVGCYDMTGNVPEWCNDWYDPDYYSVSPDSDPEGPTTGWNLNRVHRGGGWGWLSIDSRCANRSAGSPDHGRGFRIARNP